MAYRLSLNDFTVCIIVLGRLCYLKCDLNEAARKILDGNELAKGTLQKVLELSFPRSYISVMRMSISIHKQPDTG